MRFSDILRNLRGIFERKRKNPIQLERDSNLESNLKFLKVDTKSTPIQISEDTVNVQGSLTVNGVDVSTEPDDDTDNNTITALNDATENELVTVGSTTTELDSQSGLTWDGNTLRVTSTHFTPIFQVQYSSTEYFSIDVDSNSGTVLRTIGTDGYITIDADSGCVNFAKGGTVFGEINMDTGSKLEIQANTNYDIELATAGAGDITIDSDQHANIQSGTGGDINITGGISGDVNITTNGGDIKIDATDSLTFDSDGTYIMKADGTEFSVANSAFAGMILGYTTDGIDSADASKAITTTFVVTDDAHKVKFVAPPSGAVEIFVSIFGDLNRREVYFGLSDQDESTGYQAISFPNSTDVTNEHKVNTPANGGTMDTILTNRWVVTGLTSGTAYEWWLGAAASGNLAITLRWGGNATKKYPPFIMKVTALPTAVSDFAVYG